MKKATSLILVLLLCFATILPIQAATINYASKSADVAKSYVGKTGNDLAKFKYNNISGGWCAAFVSNCVKEAGVSREFFPYYIRCSNMYDYLIKQKLMDITYIIPLFVNIATVVTSPRKGDLIFYKSKTTEGDYSHVGIMIDSTQSVQGNVGGMVKLMSKPTNFHYKINGVSIQAKTSDIVYVRVNYGILQHKWIKGK